MAASNAQPPQPPSRAAAAAARASPPPSPPPSPLPSPSTPPPRLTRPAVPPRTRFQLPFPHALEQVLRPLDDALIALGQRRTAGIIHLLAMSLTFFTSIEVSLVAPPTLYALGYDAAAGLAASVLLVLGVVSQVPKKFIFRPRPWMVGRALPIRRDKTSSFPSRAVVCAVVFSWLLGQSLVEERLIPSLSPFLLWSLIILVAAMAAFARINVGAHYPSDTMLGFVLGCVVVKIGMWVEFLWRQAGCAVSEAYPQSPDAVLASEPHQLLHIGWGPLSRLSIVTLVAYAMTLISIQGFWVKCSYVYGLLMSSSAFRAAFLCCGRAPAGKAVQGVAQIFDHGSLRDHVRASATFSGLLIFGMLTRGMKGKSRIVTFTLIYLSTLYAILNWRLQPRKLLGFPGG